MIVPLFTQALLVGAILLITFMIIKVTLKTEPYVFEIVLMTPGVNKHVVVRGASLEFTHTENSKKYEVKPDRLYRVKVGKLTRLYYFMSGIKNKFLIVFQHNKKTPVKAEEVQVSTRVLKKVNDSRALGKALRSQFAVPFDLKKILLIMGFIVVVVIAYVLMTGDVTI